MNRRLLRWLGALALLCTIAISSALPTYAATGLNSLETFAVTGSGQGVAIIDMTNPTSIRARLSVPTTVTIPDLDTDGLGDNPPPGGTDPVEAAYVSEIMHVKNFCPTAGVVYGRLEGDTPVNHFVVYNKCASVGSRVAYSQTITDTTWRARYVEDSALYDPFHPGWDDQKTQDDETIDVQMVLSGGPCMATQIWDRTDEQWDEVNNNCSALSGDDETYWAFGMAYVGLDVWASNGDLGDYGNLAIRNMERIKGGTWQYLNSYDGFMRYPVVNYAASGGLPAATHPLNDQRWQYEWSSGAGWAGGATDMLLCDAENANGTNNGDQCDYTLNHRDHSGTENLEFTDNINNSVSNVQRNPTANDVLRPGDEGLANNRTYIFKANNWGTYTTLFVDVTNMSPTVKTDVTGQGYKLRAGGGTTAPTCSWVTTYKYSCTAALGTRLEEVYVKVKTKASPVTASGLSFSAGNTVTSAWTWSGFSFP